jgi:hypothetical protein
MSKTTPVCDARGEGIGPVTSSTHLFDSLLGGEITFESEFGRGTTFTLGLPG